MKRLTLLLASALVCLATAPAQEDESQAIGRGVETQLLPEVTSRLRSESLATIAWGAHIAASHRLSPAVPALLGALERLRKEPGLDAKEVRLATLALVDALVQANAKVSFQDLAPHNAGLTRPALCLLLARDVPGNREFFTDLYREHDHEGRRSYWIAGGNLLAASKDDGLGALIVPTFEYTLAITVRDPGAAVGAGTGGRAGGRFGAGKLDVPDGFPPTVLYSLATKGQVGDILIAPGAIPVFARRVERKERRVGTGANESVQLRGRQAIRLQWLAQLLGTYASALGDFEPSMTVDWTTPADYVESVTRQKADITKSFAKLVERCVDQHVLSADVAKGLEAKVVLQVFDLREKFIDPLPKLE